MTEYRLSYAAFVYCVKKRSYTINQPKHNLVSFWFLDINKTQFVEIHTDRKNNGHCGYLFFGSRDDIDSIFMDIKNHEDYDEFIEDLIDKCDRDTEWSNGEEVHSRCGILVAERKNMNTKIDDGKTIKCLRIR